MTYNYPNTDKPHTTGRKPKHTSETLQATIDNYFANPDNKPYSVLELCSELDICYETWSSYSRDDNHPFSEIIKKAKSKIASGWEKGHLHPSLSIFLLKNHLGYIDQPQQPQQQPITIQLNGMSTDELRKLMDSSNAIDVEATEVQNKLALDSSNDTDD